MKITALSIERAGVLEDLLVRDVSPGLTVWTGANESGKTTLFQLLKASLFGPGAASDRPRDRRSAAFRELLADARGVRVEVVAPGDDTPRLLEPGAPLPAALWAGLDPATAERLHAVDAEALTSLDFLTSADHRARLAGALAGAESLPGALRTLDRRLSDLLKPGRGARNPTIDATTLELADLDERIAHLGARSERYSEVIEERRKLERRADRLAGELRDLPPTTPPEPTAPTSTSTLPPRDPSPWPRLAAASAAFLGLAAAVVLAFLDLWEAAAAALALAATAAAVASRARRRPRPGSVATPTSPPPTPETASPDRRQTLEPHLADTWRRLGSLDHEARALETSDELATVLAHRETVRTTRADAVDAWATAALARALLERARERSETERVPRVLARASALLRVLTGERDLRLELADGAVSLSSLGRGTRGDGAWSSGLADLVELAVRWALLGELASTDTIPSAPLLLDDVHLRLDPERRRHLALALLELARERQVMVFSCQPELARDVEGLLRDGAGGGVAVDLRGL